MYHNRVPDDLCTEIILSLGKIGRPELVRAVWLKTCQSKGPKFFVKVAGVIHEVLDYLVEVGDEEALRHWSVLATELQEIRGGTNWSPPETFRAARLEKARRHAWT